MKHHLTILSALSLGFFLILAVTATQAATPSTTDRGGSWSRSSNTVQHTQPSTPGAPVNTVIVLDNSESQSYDFAPLPEPYHSKCSPANIDDLYACVYGGVLSDTTTIIGCNNEPISDPNFPELTRGICRPFRQVKEAAYQFIKQLRPGVDRIALVHFDELI